ncbi:iron ABC transporter permease [Amycolatopsis acidicola]|uniref:Iron ABC transporter permease n=1 Tax=Amycolatopsis acidicola TaxID=2596893 RepID=A0A5N0V2Z9_9PSEU|nr:iron ABC transporter permease [Amycolatopsis acidicola]KAA9160756.1 iron ABC transporter permease [Amycolatopsis acidicola]
MTTTLQNATPRPLAARGVAVTGRSRSPQDLLLLVATWVVVLALIAGPIVYIVIAAFSTDATDPSAGFTLESVAKVFATGKMLGLLAKSVGFALLVGVLSTGLATALAWTTVRLDLRGSRLRENLCMGSMFMAPFVTAVAWVWLATPETGVINKALQSLGVPSWLQPDILSVPGMVFVLVAHYVPYAYLFVSASMSRIDSRMEEASLLCGRGMGYTTFRVVLPLLRASLLSSVLFVGILALGEFSVPEILGQSGSFTPLSVNVYKALYSENQDLSLAAAISGELMIVCLLGLFLYGRSVRNETKFVSVSGRGHTETKNKPSRVTAAVVWVVTLAYGVISFVIPLIAMLLMALSKYLAPTIADMNLSLSNLWDAIDTSQVWTATLNSLALAIAVPVLSIFVGVAVVYLADRAKVRTARALTYVATMPLAVPGLVMGTGLLLMLIGTPLYGTLPFIGIGLVSISITHAVRLVSNGVQQIDRSLEEASQVCGVSPLKTVWSVLVPLIRPSVLSAFILIFVLTLRELNVAVILSTSDTGVLSVVAWNDSSSALTKAAAVGLLQLVVIFAGMGVLRGLFRLAERKK